LEGRCSGLLDIMFWNLPGQAEENHEILVRLFSVPAEIVIASEYKLRQFTIVY